MSSSNFNINGLTQKQVREAHKQYGPNLLSYKKENRLVDAPKSIAKEPMVVLLLVTPAVYFIRGEPVITGVAIIGITYRTSGKRYPLVWNALFIFLIYILNIGLFYKMT